MSFVGINFKVETALNVRFFRHLRRADSVKIGAINVERGKTMKTRAMKKVLSFICVLALLMSVCVVSLVGTTSAATDSYTLNVNGVETTESLEVGAALPEPDSGIAGVTFEGWYDSLEFENEVKVAGDAKKLYAKFSSTIYNFDGGNGYYDPNEMGAGLPIVADPTDSANKVIRYTLSNSRPGICFETYAGSGKGMELLSEQVGEETVYTQYEISFRYYLTAAPTDSTVGIGAYVSKAEGISQNGNKTAIQSTKLSTANVGEWKTATFIVNNNKENIDKEHTYLYFTAYYGSSATNGAILYMDDIVITKIVEKEYTYVQLDGTVEKQVATAGDAHLRARGAYYLGWYDETLTIRYDNVPATVTTLYAKYSKIEYDFEDGMNEIYDPNGNFDSEDLTTWDLVADPDDADNTVISTVYNKKRPNFGLNGAYGAKAGYTLIKGQEYTISFKYKASGITDETVRGFTLYTSNEAGVGGNGGKTSVVKLDTVVKNSDEWVEVTYDFTPTNDFVTYPYLVFTVYGGENNDGVIYVDDLCIGPKALPVSTDDVTMDFEDVEGEEFKWSVESANNYTPTSGNGYVSRGEIVEEEDGNKAFAIKHFASRGKTFYFTVNDGTKQFESINYGLYTVSFKYKVIHSETPTSVGIAYVDPVNNKVQKAFELATFENEDNTDWIDVTYTFGTDLFDINSYTSFGIFVYNSTNVPEFNVDTGLETATTVLFDDVVVSTHAEVSEMGMIRFDSVGGEEVQAIIRPAMKPVGTLPEPTKYGFDFAGWKYDTTDAEGNVISHDLTETTLVPDFVTDAYATWTVKDGFVQFDFRSNVDEFDANQPILVAKPGEPIPNFPTEVPEATSQKFIGWFTDRTFKEMVDPNKAPSKSCTLFAKWESTGEIIDFEDYPSKWFKDDGRGTGSSVTDRISLVEFDDGNHALYYDFTSGDNQSNTSSIAGAQLASGDKRYQAIAGMDYTIKFKYKVVEAKGSGAIGSVLSNLGHLWGSRQEQTGRMNYGKAEDKWLEGSYTFTAILNPEGDPTKCNYISIGCSNDCKIYIDDVVVICSYNEMNVYGSAVIFDTNGGKDMEVFSGDPGTKMELPDPVRSGYKFLGWYTDKELTTPLTATTFGEETLFVYAKWQLGEFTESFEEFPATVKQLGVHGAYSFYTSTTTGYDKSNVKSGETSLFRNGATAGVKNFTMMRSADLALNVGDDYVLTFYVKPTAIGDATGTISLLDLGESFTGINFGTVGDVIVNVSELKEGEWNEVKFEFTAASQYVGISTTAGNDMYFDDIKITLKGYTAPPTGDSTISPILVIAMVILSAGALLITGKKVFSK